MVLGHKLKGGVSYNYVIGEIIKLKKGTVTTTSLYHSKTQGKLEKNKNKTTLGKQIVDTVNWWQKQYNNLNNYGKRISGGK